MRLKKKTATFDATLVYIDEPQVITLLSNKTRIIAVAVSSDDSSHSLFFATTVSGKDWEKYLDGMLDLRYLFSYSTLQTKYTFDLNNLKNGKILIEPYWGEVNEDYLPPARFFSVNHTEKYSAIQRATDKEVLLIDGEWELQDFGQFQQRFSDIYAFLISIENWLSSSSSNTTKRKIKEAFLDRPFKGGFSYVHLFSDLGGFVPRQDQINLNKITYASPGKVEMFGQSAAFSSMQQIIENFLINRDALSESYRFFHNYLSQNHYLKIDGNSYNASKDSEDFILQQSKKIASEIGAPDFDAVLNLTQNNALVAAKVILSFYRRLKEAADYFAQGRVAYEDNSAS